MELTLLLGVSHDGLLTVLLDRTPASLAAGQAEDCMDISDDGSGPSGRFHNRNTRGELFSRELAQPLSDFFVRRFSDFGKLLLANVSNGSIRQLLHGVLERACSQPALRDYRRELVVHFMTQYALVSDVLWTDTDSKVEAIEFVAQVFDLLGTDAGPWLFTNPGFPYLFQKFRSFLRDGSVGLRQKGRLLRKGGFGHQAWLFAVFFVILFSLLVCLSLLLAPQLRVIATLMLAPPDFYAVVINDCDMFVRDNLPMRSSEYPRGSQERQAFLLALDNLLQTLVASGNVDLLQVGLIKRCQANLKPWL